MSNDSWILFNSANMITSKGEPIFAHVNMHGFRWKFMAPSSSRAWNSVMKIAECSSLKILLSPNTSREIILISLVNSYRFHYTCTIFFLPQCLTTPWTCGRHYHRCSTLSSRRAASLWSWVRHARLVVSCIRDWTYLRPSACHGGEISWNLISGLLQDCISSSELAVELLQSCSAPSELLPYQSYLFKQNKHPIYFTDKFKFWSRLLWWRFCEAFYFRRVDYDVKPCNSIVDVICLFYYNVCGLVQRRYNSVVSQF